MSTDNPIRTTITHFDRWVEEMVRQDTPEAIMEVNIAYGLMRRWAASVAIGKTVLGDKFKIEHAIQFSQMLIDMEDWYRADEDESESEKKDTTATTP